jgi:hypothetical protein
MTHDRFLPDEQVEGEISLVIGYDAGKTPAVEVLSGAMCFIEALDKLDRALLSSVDTSLEPVSILNDIQHSSLKLLLARALKSVPDDALKSMEWKKWVGNLLVKAKYAMLGLLEADTPEIARELERLSGDYAQAPGVLIPYQPPRLPEIVEALDRVRAARAGISNTVMIQTERGDIELPFVPLPVSAQVPDIAGTLTNHGEEIFKIKSPDMLGEAQWTVLRNNRTTRVGMLHRGFLERYHRREIMLLPGDALHCRIEETIQYDAAGQEIERRVSIVEVLKVISPPLQGQRLPDES